MAAYATEEEVQHSLLALDTSKSSGPDGISPTMLKQSAGAIAPSLTKLLNLKYVSATMTMETLVNRTNS